MLGFEAGDFVDAPGVPPALEFGLQPNAHHAVDELFAEKVGGKTEDVGVVVPPAHLGRDAVVAGGGPNTGNLIRGYAHADTRAADEHAAIDAAFADRLSHLKGEVGVIDALAAGGPHVDRLM